MSAAAHSFVLPRPFLKWAGGKTKLIGQYQPYFPEKFTTYYEPFLGGGAVFFYLAQEHPSVQAVLTDINPELINAYCCVRDKVEDLIELLFEHASEHSKHNKEYYYWVRSRSYNTDTEKAARLIYLNKTCYNGLYRENSKGEFNVPIGRYKNPNICQPDLLRSVSSLLKPAQIQVRKFPEILDFATSSEDFVYFDPPYYPISTTSNFTAYSRDNFKESEQLQLRNVFAELSERGVKVMLSNSNCDFIKQIYSDSQAFKIVPHPKLIEISAARGINSKSCKRGPVKELLISSV
ncbi:MAG: DNA adenine methylase [Microcoleus sp. PH2017_10_PVI_O_A]|uniref:DNA adenine methylase n=1 Tax=unclassified Microcoleus TaxID=2642155 RepID=UPI001DBFA6CC|nr:MULTISPECIES: DNA adenine methylase [unclassified Microcoleus]TAE77400.1 MAG: DNA adenine methylase [Oscillatoriales cyanobacterium]MCC3408731.1 DNA adenine methylase [Microcoleus sp. PH2017_10_PVI_O_A]MCC3462818.1 DNA adenine methylase [Microcoleus sp. PH2017_11_PCY_U_A]MCC3481301.1 DNA adenine methylase [Microcoleus sp. PH2017_12_PCY_D_A]MCC3529505.1 DNA adenine methylase [Microcoleus sp. PH2017_21_RUC_O_A]